jgi:hypothetical protein
MADVDSLAEHLVASDRWSEERARQLVDDLLACGPATAVGLSGRPPGGRARAAAATAAAAFRACRRPAGRTTARSAARPGRTRSACCHPRRTPARRPIASSRPPP